MNYNKKVILGYLHKLYLSGVMFNILHNAYWVPHRCFTLLYISEVNEVICLPFIAASSSERHIFDDLTSSELQEVIDYLYSQPSLGLSREEVSLKSSYLRMVEAVNPTKKGALQYLDNDGPRPVRQANAILYR